MTERVNLVDAYDNRSVIAKMVSMEERISGAEDSIEKTVEDGQTSIDSKVDTGVTKINSLLTGLDDTIAKAEAAAATAETASTKAETAAKSVDEDIVAANNAVIDAKAYATTGILHDGTAVTSADNIAKSCETYADTASKSATAASASATAAAASQTAAGQMAASAETSAKDASGYLDTVKASADAAATSETNAAASEAKAQAIADSMDVSNMVTLADTQTVTGAKFLTSTANTFKAASRSSKASAGDVLNAGDINTVNGSYNNLIHRTGTVIEQCEHLLVDTITDRYGQKSCYCSKIMSTPSAGVQFYFTHSSTEVFRGRINFEISSPIGDLELVIFIRENNDVTVIDHYTVIKNTMSVPGGDTIHLTAKGYSLKAYWMSIMISADAYMLGMPCALTISGVSFDTDQTHTFQPMTSFSHISTTSYKNLIGTIDIPIDAYTED
jgi:hypothetical protein